MRRCHWIPLVAALILTFRGNGTENQMQYFNIQRLLHRLLHHHQQPGLALAYASPARKTNLWRAATVLALAITLGAIALGTTVTAFAQNEKEPPAEAAAFKVIVHKDNPNDELTRKDVDRFFIRRYKSWDRLDFDSVAEVVNLPPKNPIREAFSNAIHQKKVSAIEAFWQKMLFSGRDAPPQTRETDEAVILFVAGGPGRIGYISSDTPIDPKKDQVKVLNVVY